ncbi:42957_t:CDS:2, partial [Gigaspora margarita]
MVRKCAGEQGLGDNRKRIRDPLDDNPMEVFFQKKLASARQSAKNSRPRRDDKSEMSGASFANVLRGMGGMAPNLIVQWSMPGQQYFQQPDQPSFAPGGVPTYGNMLPYPSTYQYRYENQRRPWSRSWAGQGSPRSYIPNGPRRKDSFGSFSRLLEKGDKTGGIGGVLVGKQDTSVSKGSEIVGFRENTNKELLWINQEGQGGVNFASMGISNLVADVSRGPKRGDGITTGGRNYCPRTVRPKRTVQQSGLETNCSKHRLVDMHLTRAENLAFRATGEVAYPAKVDMVKVFLGWLEMAGLAPRVQEYLGAVVRVHREKGFKSPVDDFR